MISASSPFFSLLPDAFQHQAFESTIAALQLSISTVLLTIILEVASLPTVRGVLQQPNGRSLYRQAIAMNFVNHFVFGIPVYVIAGIFLCTGEVAESYFLFAIRSLGIITVHALLYYAIHKAFHVSPKLYVHHRFHHRFNKHTPPVSANAVSFVEYLVAYIIPFAIGAMLVHPHETEFRFAIAYSSVTNLLVHTPRLEALSKILWPIFVSTHAHQEHHRRLTTNYASPTFNVDWILNQIYVVLGKSA
jgi:sterol desaturase/sphingolipid hydroxylase (fatty acid hydroxylase superfamily)